MRNKLLTLALLFVSVFVLSCIGPADPILHRETVRGVIGLLEDYYNSASVGGYQTYLLSIFTFHFSEHDQNQGLPATYDYTEDVASTRSLFEHEGIGADNIDLTFAIPEFDEPAEGTNTFKVELIPYDLYVTNSLDQITYHAQHTCSFELIRIDGNWYISQWWDEVHGYITGGSGEQMKETTWGQIKSM